MVHCMQKAVSVYLPVSTKPKPEMSLYGLGSGR